MNKFLSENERLLAQAIDNDIVKTVVNEGYETVNECQKCLELKTELLNKKDFVDKETYDKLCREHGLVITALKNDLRKLKGKALDKEATETHSVDPIQDLLSNISRTCPTINNFDPQLVVVTPRKKDKKVRFAESLTSTENTKTDSTSNLVSNKRVLHSTGVRLSTCASGSQPSGNTRNDRIQQTPSSNSKNKVEAHPRNVKSSLNKRNGHVKFNGSASLVVSVQNSGNMIILDYVLFYLVDDCMSSDNLCVSNSMNDVKFRAKSKKRKSKKEIWKPTGKVFNKMGYIWRPTGRTFTIVGNACPLTRTTTTNEVPSRKPIVLESESPKPVVKLVYSRKPRKNKNTESVSKTKVIKPMSANKQEPSKSLWVYYVEGLGHNLFSVGQFCDSNLEVAFRQHTCFIRNLEGQIVEVTPRKTDKKVRFAESHTSTDNTKTDSTSNIVSNKRVLHSTGVRLSTSASGSQPSGNTRNDRIQQTPSSNSKNKVEAHPRNVKSSLNKRNGTVKVNGSASVQN
ncbi:hypothetical protein Tco_0426370 [Tanacetum coccineum]